MCERVVCVCVLFATAVRRICRGYRCVMAWKRGLPSLFPGSALREPYSCGNRSVFSFLQSLAKKPIEHGENPQPLKVQVCLNSLKVECKCL